MQIDIQTYRIAKRLPLPDGSKTALTRYAVTGPNPGEVLPFRSWKDANRYAHIRRQSPDAVTAVSIFTQTDIVNPDPLRTAKRARVREAQGLNLVFTPDGQRRV